MRATPVRTRQHKLARLRRSGGKGCSAPQRTADVTRSRGCTTARHVSPSAATPSVATGLTRLQHSAPMGAARQRASPQGFAPTEGTSQRRSRTTRVERTESGCQTGQVAQLDAAQGSVEPVACLRASATSVHSDNVARCAVSQAPQAPWAAQAALVRSAVSTRSVESGRCASAHQVTGTAVIRAVSDALPPSATKALAAARHWARRRGSGSARRWQLPTRLRASARGGGGAACDCKQGTRSQGAAAAPGQPAPDYAWGWRAGVRALPAAAGGPPLPRQSPL